MTHNKRRGHMSGRPSIESILFLRVKNFVETDAGQLAARSTRDPTETVEYLRSSFAEYERMKVSALRTLVVHALERLSSGPRQGKEEVLASSLPSDQSSDRRASDSAAMNDEDEGPEEDQLQLQQQPEREETAGKDASRDKDRDETPIRSPARRDSREPVGGSSLHSLRATAEDRSLGPNLLNSALRSQYASPAASLLPPAAPKGEPTTSALPSSTIRGVKRLRSGMRIGSSNTAAAAADPRLALDGSSSIATPAERPTARYADLGGIESILQDVRELIEYPLTHPEIYSHLGVDPPRGILLHGPPGCGKTVLAHAIAGECGVTFFKLSAPEIVSGMSGESEAKLRQLFQDAASSSPAIVFIDEIDAITGKRETAVREMERRIVAQLLTCMDDLSLERTGGKPVLVIGATNRADALDSALRRAGRFDREIALGIPDEAARAGILRVMCRKYKLAPDVVMDFDVLARRTPGFVGADLEAVAKEAAVLAVHRIFSSEDLLLARKHTPLTDAELQRLAICMADFEAAIAKVQPSSKREGFATIPDVSFDDIGALQHVREELRMAVLEPIRRPERFLALGLTPSTGVLLYGPPGCGKTLLAKAIARDSGANFISIKGPELLNKYVGESERAVRQVFSRARASAPCVIFFDELDSLAPKRGSEGGGSGGGNQSSERVVNQLLTEMDGLEGRGAVHVIAATNRPDIIDPAMLRPGRLDKLLYVPLPTSGERELILFKLLRKTPLSPDVDVVALAHSSRLAGFSGADLAGLVREATVNALRESCSIVSSVHFEQALSVVMPSVSEQDERLYEMLRGKIRRSRNAI